MRTAKTTTVLETLEARQLMSVTPAGSPDYTFGNDGYVDTHQTASVVRQLIQSDGKVLVVAQSNRGGTSIVTRYTAAGKLDTSYAPGGADGNGVQTVTGQANDAALTPDGKLVVVGTVDNQVTVSRFTAAGQPDASFAKTGTLITRLVGTPATDYEFGGRVVVDPAGRAVVVAAAQSIDSDAHPGSEFFLARFSTAGGLDKTFNQTGVRVLGNGSLATHKLSDVLSAALLANADGSYVVAAAGQKLTVTKLTATGTTAATATTDPAYVFSHAANREIDLTSIARTADGKLIYGGTVYGGSGGGVVTGIVGRLTNTFAADKTFNGGLGVEDTPAASRSVGRVLAQPDGKIVFTSAGSSNEGQTLIVQRLNADGSQDATFGTGGQAYVPLYRSGDAGDASLLPDGRILVAGSTASGTLGLERLTADPKPIR